MPIPEYPEPGLIPGHQQIPQQRSINFSSAIPLKKRRFPILEEKLSPAEEHQDSKDKQDRKITDGDLSKSVASPINSDARKTSLITIKKEVTPTSCNLGPLDDLENKKDFLGSGNSSESGNVMQGIVGGKTEGTDSLELSTRKMNVELSLGSKEQLISVIPKPENPDSTLLSWGLHDEKLALKNDSNQVCANRSNWDLNTTMDVWEGSTISDAFAHRLLDGFNKTNGCQDDKSSMTTEGKTGLHSGKGKGILDDNTASFSNASAQPSQQCKNEDSLLLVLASPSMNNIREHLSLSDNLFSVNPYISSEQVQASIPKVKSEPADYNSKHNGSLGSSSSSRAEFLKIDSVERELLNTPNITHSTINHDKLVECISVKSEVVQEHHNQEASKSDDIAVMQSARRVIQHQDRCSPSSALPFSLMHPNPIPSRLSSCSELITSSDLLKQYVQPAHSNTGNLSVMDPNQDDGEHKNELSQNKAVAFDEHSIDIPLEKHEGGLGSYSEPQQNIAVDAFGCNEDEEYEDGEVREPIQLLAQEDSIPEDSKNKSLELVAYDSEKLQLSVPSGDQNVKMPGFEGNDVVKRTPEEIHSNFVEDGHEPNNNHNSLPITFDKVVTDEKVFALDKKLDFSGNNVGESPGKEVLVDEVGVEQGDDAIEKVVTGNCSVENDSSFLKVEAPLDSNDTVKDSSSAGNKSRIINLARASVVTTTLKTKSIPNRLFSTRNGKEKYSDLDGEMQPRGNRDDHYDGGSNKFVKGRVVHDSPQHRNSRPNFMFGKGRGGRFGSLRGDWNSGHYFSSDYRIIRRKHNPSISDIDLDSNGYDVQKDGNNRRKTMNDEFPLIRRPSLRRISSGDREPTRGVQMLHRIPRNMSPRRLSTEGSSDVIGLRHDDKFMRLSDDIGDPVYERQQTMYDKLDDQLVQRERIFSTIQRKNYPRIRSKSPVRSRTRSPGPWSSPRRKSPNRHQDLNQHRSPPMFRIRRMRSPDRVCFRDEMVPRRRGSPSFVARHNNDMRDGDHVHSRPPVESNRRSSPGRVFQRNARRHDGLDSREMGDGDDEYIDERRKLFDRRGPVRQFRPNYNGENEKFQFHMNDGEHREYRLIPDAEDAEFVVRREREFDGRQRRIRNMEEQEEGGSYRDVWHEDEGFPDGRVKRRRF